MTERGERGQTGVTGATGAEGAEGRAGTTGIPGAAGAAGAAGAPGEAGTEGIAGKAGETGATGPRARYGAAGFLILMTFSFFGFVQVDREAERALTADRQGCERSNTIREISAQELQDEIAQSEIALRGPLRSLESLRGLIERGVENDRQNLKRLRDSVADHPLKHRPYAIDCEDAFP